MTELIPSYLTKLGRARKHLAELQAAVDGFTASRPYEPYLAQEGRRKTWRYRFTASTQNTDIPIIAADVVYNLRSGLDHLAAALVPSSQASHVAFPIFWPGVWDAAAPGENDQVQRDRGRWTTYTRHMRPEAVAILRTLQPDDSIHSQIHHLRALNRLSNTDRHTRFPTFASGLRDVTATIDGGRAGRIPIAGVPEGFRSGFLVDGGELGFPGFAELPTKVDLQGTPLVMIRLGDGQQNIEIPETFENALRYIENEVVNPLLPYVWVAGS